MASSFGISRRRMVVPIYKRWEATTVRLQVVQQASIIQILAFFQDFSHGECMAWVVKNTDVLEAFSKGGKAGLKFADAKFPLPKGEEDQTRSFVCLDMPEYPGEHDDIVVMFDSERGKLRREFLPGRFTPCSGNADCFSAERDTFQRILPAMASTTGGSRMALRR